MANKIIVVFIAALVLVGAGAFYGGMVYGKNQPKQSMRNGTQIQAGQLGGQFNRAGRAGANFISGEIIAKDDKSITVKLPDGGSKIVFLSGTTQIMKSVDGSMTDLATGKNAMITGSANSDGSLTAQSIQLRPASPNKATTTPQL